MAWCLNKRAVLLPPKLGELQFGNYLKSGKLAFFYSSSFMFLIDIVYWSLLVSDKFRGVRWFSNWEDSCCSSDDDTWYIHGGSPGARSYVCTSNLHPSLACCITTYWCTWSSSSGEPLFPFSCIFFSWAYLDYFVSHKFWLSTGLGRQLHIQKRLC